MSSVKALKEALISELHKQITTGTVIEKVDEETGERIALVVSPVPALLSVAAKVVKDFNDEAREAAQPNGVVVAQAAEMSDLLKRYKNRATVAPSA